MQDSVVVSILVVRIRISLFSVTTNNKIMKFKYNFISFYVHEGIVN